MEANISRKISVLSLIMVTGVAMYHSDLRYLTDYATVLSMVIMPYFFTITGYFAIKGITKENQYKRIGKRVKTLLVPYILWNLIQLVYYMISTGFSYRLSVKQALVSFFFSPINIPSWYLFSVFVIILFLPVFRFFFSSKVKAVIGLILAFVLAFSAHIWFAEYILKLGTAGGFIIKTIQYMPAFYIGGFATIFDERFLKVSPKRAIITVPIAIVMLFLLCYSFGRWEEVFILITNIYPIVYWQMHPECIFNNKKVILFLTDPTLFLCMSHIMVGEIVERIFRLPDNIRFELIVLPVSYILIYAVYYICRKYIPWFIGPLTGGRAIKKS